MSNAVAATPPKGVGTKVMWGKLKSATAKLDKYKDNAIHAGEIIALAGIAGATAIGTAFLFKKFPDWATIPGTEIPTQPFVGGAFIVLGMIKKSKMSYGLVAIGLGFLLPYLFDLGEELEFGGA
jgi:hypothetical protein